MANPWGRLMRLAQKVRGGAKPNFVVMDVKRQSLDDLRGQTLHEQRKAGDLSHVDHEKTKDNIRDGYGGHHDDPKAAVEAFLKDKNVKVDKRNTRPCTSFVLSASHEYFDSPQAMEKWVKASMKWARDEFGEDIAHTSLHLDEKTPHLHLKVVPTYEKKTKRKTVRQASQHKHPAFKGYRSYEGLLDRYAACMEPLGLLRGEKVPEEAGRTHRTARQWVNAMTRRWAGRKAEMALLDEREAKVSAREEALAERSAALNGQKQAQAQVAADLIETRDSLQRWDGELRKAAQGIKEKHLMDLALDGLRTADRVKPKEQTVQRVEKRARRSTKRKGKAPAER